jgi:uncharacterized BrkB/YihY/UPF0761 family membrane protein
VVYKVGDDQGPYLAALITFYRFLSLFPLLLLLVTILGFVPDRAESARSDSNWSSARRQNGSLP